MATINNYSLQNIENYNKELSDTVLDVFVKYINLTNEFIIQCCENVYIKNKSYNRYIINKGVETFSHIFKMLLLYTMNLELTYYHCQKSLFYYIEFIGQITGENHQFLQLTLKDSALFVFKKTIFDINNDYRNSFSIKEKDNLKMEVIVNLIKIYNGLLCLLIERHQFPSDNQASLLKELSTNVQKIANNIVNLFINKKEETNYILQLKVIEYFVENLKNKELEIDVFNIFNLTELFIKKLSKQPLTFADLSKKMDCDRFNELLLENSSNIKTINWLFSSQ